MSCYCCKSLSGGEINNQCDCTQFQCDTCEKCEMCCDCEDSE